MLTTTALTKWQKSIDKSISTDLISVLKATGDSASKLSKIMTSSDGSGLYQRFVDLNKLTTEATKQLTNFMNSLDGSLKKYITTIWSNYLS